MQVYYAACRKTQQGIQFLYKILPGVADGSFGVEVAKLAQLPDPVIVRAQQLLQLLERQSENIVYSPTQVLDASSSLKHRIANLEHELWEKEKKLAALNKIDYENLSPKAAFDILWMLRET